MTTSPVVPNTDGSHPLVKVKARCGRPRRRKYTKLTGAAAGDEYFVWDTNPDTAMTALLDRVFYHKDLGSTEYSLVETVVPAVDCVSWLLRPFLTAIREFSFITHPDPLDGYAERWYRDRRYPIYARAEESLKRKCAEAADATVRSFVKVEKAATTVRQWVCDATKGSVLPFPGWRDPLVKQLVPRVVSPRDPRYNIAVGRFLRKIEHAIYHSIDRMFGQQHAVFKGLNADSQGRALAQLWSQYRDPVAVGGDMSRFDQHVSAPILHWEHSVYKCFYRGQDRAELARLLHMQLDNRCTMHLPEARFDYRCSSRMSGDMNTGLGNVVIMCALLYSHLGTGWYSLVDNGDDFVLILERTDLPRLTKLASFCHDLGFILKLEAPVSTLERIEFCQTHPVNVGGYYRMVRNYPSHVDKDSTFIKPLTQATFGRYLESIGRCGLALCSGVPCCQAYYQWLLRAAAGRALDDPSMETGMRQLAKGMVSSATAISEEARFSFWLAFGVHPYAQLAIEQYYASCPAPSFERGMWQAAVLPVGAVP